VRQSRTVRTPSRLAKLLTIGLLTLIWGTTWSAIRVSLEGFPPITAVAIRFAVAGSLLAGYAWLTGVPLRPRGWRELKLWVLHAVLSFCVSYGVVFWAQQWVPSGLASVLFASFTLMVAVLAHVAVPGERLTPAGAVGVTVGLTGIGVIYASDLAAIGGRQIVVAAFVMLASPLASAVAAVAVKRWGSGLHPVSLNAAGMLAGATAMAVLAVTLEDWPAIPPGWGAVAAMLYLAVFGSALSFTLYFWLLEHMEVSHLALIGYLTPVVAVTVGVLWFDEPLSARLLAGSVLVMAGVVLAARRRGPASDGPETPVAVPGGARLSNE